MPVKKSELYSSLWKSCDELRGGMDASQYKDYVLVLLFVKYVSDKYAGQPDALIEVPPGGGFRDMAALKGDPEIGEKINKIIAKLAEANDLKGVIDVADFNNPDKLGRGKEMVDRLSNLVAIFENPDLDFSRNRAEGDDILGDAYEYLMRNFATESGKSKGQFYTPAEVSRIMAKVIGISQAQHQSQTIYDPTCGSGSLLLKAADEAPRGVTIYGQEMDNATAALAKMNMILHDNPTAEIWQDNTLANPHFKNSDGSLKTFDFAVANPPFSNKSWSNGIDPQHDEYNRFADGVPPKKNGDFAFMMHLIRSLKSTGSGAIVMPHGVLFRGNVEGEIRKNIIRKGYIKGIIGLPPNLFYGTSISACIIVIDKENAQGRTGIFMIDASKGFIKDGNKNRLRHQDIHKIVDVFIRQVELPKYSRMVNLTEIEANDSNLNIPRYIDSTESEDLQDIEAHLLGGIPNFDIDDLARYWEVFPELRTCLFSPGSHPGYSDLIVAASEAKHNIFANPEFVIFTNVVNNVFSGWKDDIIARLKTITFGSHPKQLITAMSEDLLTIYSEVKLIDRYDIYQQLMTYWTNTMQDDVYLIVDSGWTGANKLRLIVEQNHDKNKEKPDLIIGGLKYKADLIPPRLIIEGYFIDERQSISDMQLEKDETTRKMEVMQEEYGGEEGLLEEVIDAKDKITKTALQSRIKEIKNDLDFSDELAVLKEYLTLVEHGADIDKKIKVAQKMLDNKVFSKYMILSEEEIKKLVVVDKWLTTLTEAVCTVVEHISLSLTSRIKELAERYDSPLPQLTREVNVLAGKVDEHLKKMGFVWS